MIDGMSELLAGFAGSIWSIFTSLTVPGMDFTFSALYLAFLAFGFLAFAVRSLLRMGGDGGSSFRAGKSARKKKGGDSE